MYSLNPARRSRGLFYFISCVLTCTALAGFSLSSALLYIIASIITAVFIGVITLNNGGFDLRRGMPALMFLALCFLSSIPYWAQPATSSALLSILSAIELGLLTSYLEANERRRIPGVIVGTAGALTIILAASTLFPGLLSFVVVNDNICAGYILIGFVLAATQARKRKYLLLSTLLMGGILISGSRSALCAGVVSAAIYWWRDMPRRARWVAIAAGAAAILYIINGLTADVSLLNRISWWQAGWRMFKDHPLFGAGCGMFSSEYLVYRPVVTENTAYAHNIIVQLFAECGIAGACLFVAVLASAGWRANRIAPPAAAAGAFLLFNLFDYAWFVPAHQCAFFVLLCIIQDAREENTQQVPLAVRAAIACLAAACVVVAIPIRGVPAGKFASLSEEAYADFQRSRDKTDLARAVGFQEAAVRAAPRTAAFHADLAWLYRVSGNADGARHEMLIALRRDPLNVRFQRAIRSMISQRG